MLTETDRRGVRAFRRRLTGVVPILDLWVYGSRARGNAEPDSDLDLFIQVAEATPELRERIREIGFETDRVIATVVTTPYDLEQGAMGANPLVLNIQREGIHP